MSPASGCSYTPKRNWNDIPDLLRGNSVKVSVEDGKICNQTTMMRKRLERFGEVVNADDVNGFGRTVVVRSAL